MADEDWDGDVPEEQYPPATGRTPVASGGFLQHGGNYKAIADARRLDRYIDEAAKSDPVLVVQELFAAAAKGTLKLYRKLNSGREEPTRQLIEASKETRALADRLYDIIQAQGSAAEDEAFLAALGSRFQEAAPRLAEALRVTKVSHPDERGDLLDEFGEL